MRPPEPPPEAALIRLVREAAGIKLPAAATAAGISKARWSQIETGYETRSGGWREVRGRPVTIAHMAYAVGVTPERLEAAAHEYDSAAEQRRVTDAAAILREILRSPHPLPPALEAVPDGGHAASQVEEFMTDPAVPGHWKEMVAGWIRLLREGEDKVNNGA